MTWNGTPVRRSRATTRSARPRWIATTRFELATILARRAHVGDAERARQLLAECLETCDVLELPYLAGRARAVLDEVSSSA